MILFGNPGIGKTTLANVIVKMLDKTSDTYNASSDNKEKLKKIIEKDKNEIIIVDEIHRMKKDIQDYLLPFVERGDVIMIGITTINPYRAVNPAIRSRASVYKLMPLSNEDLEKLVRKAISYYHQSITRYYYFVSICFSSTNRKSLLTKQRALSRLVTSD